MFVRGKVLVALNVEWEKSKHILDEIDYEEVEIVYHPDRENKEDIKDIVLIYLKRETNEAVLDTIKQLKENSYVVFAEPDYIAEYFITPNDPLFNRLWGMQRIRANNAWNFARGSRNILVGIIDSGVDAHPDLRGNLLIPRGQFSNFQDRTGHGTHIAGTIGAIGNNRQGIVGVCWNVGLVVFRVGNNSFDIASSISAINFCNQNNIPIINASWGTRSNSAALRFAISQYRGLFVAAAGNNGTNNDRVPMFPASYNLPNLIAVAATNQNNNLASFSNFGQSVHIAAPGQSILSTDLRGRYTNMSGTSMAAPCVVGAAALLLSFRPRLTIRQLREIILTTARRLPSLQGRVATGLLDVGAMIQRAR
jgi:subtilisin family serine protease